MPIGFSPLASHCSTAGSPRRAVWFLNLISNCGGANAIKQTFYFKKNRRSLYNIDDKNTLNADENDCRETGADAIGCLTKVVTFARLLNVANRQRSVLDTYKIV
jgi:hypothetical protein